ncbi:hypothetical protein BDV19DRAFT_359718 [Aspergillus venezuelensis]
MKALTTLEAIQSVHLLIQRAPVDNISPLRQSLPLATPTPRTTGDHCSTPFPPVIGWQNPHQPLPALAASVLCLSRVLLCVLMLYAVILSHCHYV